MIRADVTTLTQHNFASFSSKQHTMGTPIQCIFAEVSAGARYTMHTHAGSRLAGLVTGHIHIGHLRWGVALPCQAPPLKGTQLPSVSADQHQHCHDIWFEPAVGSRIACVFAVGF